MRTYFRSQGRLIRADIDTENIKFALVKTLIMAANEKIEPDSAVVAVIDGGKTD